MNKQNRKGVALLVVAIMVVLAVPMTLVYLNLGTSQKEQSMKFDSVLKVEQVTLSGINAGFAKLKGGDNLGYQNFSGEISGDDRYDLNLTPSGKGFFQQDLYLMLSKSKDTKGKYNSIIMTDAEQFPRTVDGEVNVITHDYWATEEPYEIGVVADVISMRNSRGKDQLRYLDVKKYEMETSPDKFVEDMRKLGSKLPPDVNRNWSEVVAHLASDKIGNSNVTSFVGIATISNKPEEVVETNVEIIESSITTDLKQKTSETEVKKTSKDGYNTNTLIDSENSLATQREADLGNKVISDENNKNMDLTKGVKESYNKIEDIVE